METLLWGLIGLVGLCVGALFFVLRGYQKMLSQMADRVKAASLSEFKTFYEVPQYDPFPARDDETLARDEHERRQTQMPPM